MFTYSRTIIFVLVCSGLAACAGPASSPAPDAGADSERRADGTGVAYRDGSVRVLENAVMRVRLGGAPRLGNPAARIGIVEFSNYQCLHCRDFHLKQFARLRQEYIDTGLVQFIHRDLPLKMFAQSVPAAVTARCAGAQGRYWEMHDALFDNQGRLGAELYAKLARQLKLDEAKFSACIEDRAHGEAIVRDLATAQRLGFTGTPSFLIGTIEGDALTVVREARGAPAFEMFAQEIEKLRQPPSR